MNDLITARYTGGAASAVLYSDVTPSGVLLEDLLEQLLAEVGAKQTAEPCRETAMVLTNLEQALLWQLRRGQNRGSVTVSVHDPRKGPPPSLGSCPNCKGTDVERHGVRGATCRGCRAIWTPQ